MAEHTPPWFIEQSNAYNAWDIGLPYRDLISEGIVASGDLAVAQRGAGANNSVDVAAGSCWVLGDDDVHYQPVYRCYSDATKNITLTQDATNPRIALIVARVYDAHFAGATYTWDLEAILGTPAGSPVAPALPNTALLLATVTVPAVGGNVTNAQITDNRSRAQVGGGQAQVSVASDGWTSIAGACTYSSVDGHTYVMTIAGDYTGILGIGDWVKVTQSSVIRYFKVSLTPTYAGGNTTVTMYGGTDQVLANAAITSPAFSHANSPFGVNINPDKWTELLTSSANRTTTSPTNGTWYNAESLALPIGVWLLTAGGEPYADVASPATLANSFATLSTANNTESDSNFTIQQSIYMSIAGQTTFENNPHAFLITRPIVQALTAKTTYYLNYKSNFTTTAGSVVGLIGSTAKLFIRAAFGGMS